MNLQLRHWLVGVYGVGLILLMGVGLYASQRIQGRRGSMNWQSVAEFRMWAYTAFVWPLALVVVAAVAVGVGAKTLWNHVIEGGR
jgi:hypothetical protein